MKALDEIKARADEVEDGTKQYTIGQAFMVTRRSQGDVPKLLAAIDAALSVHVEGTFQRLDPQQECKHCRYAYPCVTVRAITEALR